MSNVTNCPDCNLPRFHGVAGYAGPQCLCHWKGTTLPKMYDELMAKNATLEAECDRLRQDIKNAFNDDLKMATMKQQEQEIIDLRAQLESIRAAGGEEVEVVGYAAQIPNPRFEDWYAVWTRERAAGSGATKLMTVAQHSRIVAAMAAELARINGLANCGSVQNWLTLSDDDKAKWFALYCDADKENVELRAEMAEIKAQEPVAYVLFRDGEVCYEADNNIVISNVPGDETDLYQWLPVFALPPLAGKVAAPDGVTIYRDMMGAMHIKLGDFDFIQIQYQYPYTDNASTQALAERIAALLAGQQTEVKP